MMLVASTASNALYGLRCRLFLSSHLSLGGNCRPRMYRMYLILLAGPSVRLSNFVTAYRVFCLAPPPEGREVFERLRAEAVINVS